MNTGDFKSLLYSPKNKKVKTKFILHGGFTPGNTNEDNGDFYAEILKDAPNTTTKILIVPFAKDPERVAITTRRVMDEFIVCTREQCVYFETATEESFMEQVQSADIIYFQGGTTLKLLQILKEFTGLKEALSGKIVAGESAGANVLASVFYSKSTNNPYEGLGFLPIKLIPHYTDEYKDKLDNLMPKLETVMLNEYEHKVYEVDL